MIKFGKRKSMLIRESGRSSDYISPSFGFGCLLNCTYCYMKRHKPKGLDVATNIHDILTEINNHSYFSTIEKPNQTDPKFVTYDISCNEDFALHYKYYDWRKIFEFFKNHDIAKATLATKIIPKAFLEYNPNKKVRIRFSLMPQKISDVLEPNTPSILERILAVNEFIEAGYEVHLNFSPVVIYDGWLSDYEKLFNQVDKYVKYKDEVKSEVIFLTHNYNKHVYNEIHKLTGEEYIWRPDLQEEKISQYGGNNLRYKLNYKQTAIQKFIKVHNQVIPWNTIRYIF